MNFPLDPNAPPLRVKKYDSLPWRCQYGCAGGCNDPERDFDCPKDPPSGRPFFRGDAKRYDLARLVTIVVIGYNNTSIGGRL